MILSDVDIKKEIAAKRIVIEPKPDYSVQLGPCSIDFRLSHNFRVFEHSTIPFVDLGKKIPDELTREITVKKGGSFIVQPGELVLASTIEWLEIADDIVGRMEGRSSLGRLGVIVHATASIFQPGWKGNAVLELSNISRLPVALYPGMRICSFSFEQLSSPTSKPYYKDKNSLYKNQKGTVASKIKTEK